MSQRGTCTTGQGSTDKCYQPNPERLCRALTSYRAGLFVTMDNKPLRLLFVTSIHVISSFAVAHWYVSMKARWEGTVKLEASDDHVHVDGVSTSILSERTGVVRIEHVHQLSEWMTFDDASKSEPDVRAVYLTTGGAIPAFLSLLSMQYGNELRVGIMNTDDVEKLSEWMNERHLPTTFPQLIFVFRAGATYSYGSAEGEEFTLSSLTTFLRFLAPSSSDVAMFCFFLGSLALGLDLLLVEPLQTSGQCVMLSIAVLMSLPVPVNEIDQRTNRVRLLGSNLSPVVTTSFLHECRRRLFSVGYEHGCLALLIHSLALTCLLVRACTWCYRTCSRWLRFKPMQRTLFQTLPAETADPADVTAASRSDIEGSRPRHTPQVPLMSETSHGPRRSSLSSSISSVRDSDHGSDWHSLESSGEDAALPSRETATVFEGTATTERQPTSNSSTSDGDDANVRSVRLRSSPARLRRAMMRDRLVPMMIVERDGRMELFPLVSSARCEIPTDYIDRLSTWEFCPTDHSVASESSDQKPVPNTPGSFLRKRTADTGDVWTEKNSHSETENGPFVALSSESRESEDISWTQEARFRPGYVESSECVICLERFLAGEKLCGLPCKHAFHYACIRRWLMEGNHICPLCRKSSFQSPSRMETRETR